MKSDVPWLLYGLFLMVNILCLFIADCFNLYVHKTCCKYFSGLYPTVYQSFIGSPKGNNMPGFQHASPKVMELTSYVLLLFQEIVAIVPLIVFVSGFLTTLAAKPLNVHLGQRVSLLGNLVEYSCVVHCIYVFKIAYGRLC